MMQAFAAAWIAQRVVVAYVKRVGGRSWTEISDPPIVRQAITLIPDRFTPPPRRGMSGTGGGNGSEFSGTGSEVELAPFFPAEHSEHDRRLSSTLHEIACIHVVPAAILRDAARTPISTKLALLSTISLHAPIEGGIPRPNSIRSTCQMATTFYQRQQIAAD
jgi:hypothetical protein